jgi:hypothetical protein
MILETERPRVGPLQPFGGVSLAELGESLDWHRRFVSPDQLEAERLVALEASKPGTPVALRDRRRSRRW